MLNKELRQTIICLKNSGKSNREISRLLKTSRNTVKKILQQGADVSLKRLDSQSCDIMPIVRQLFKRCLGNAVRIHEVLKDEYNINIAYSTLTKLINNAALRKPKKRFGEYVFEPGEEMQHDTSPHTILLGEKKVTAQCASLIFGYSRMLFVQYYPCFTRFEAKSFLKAALEFMRGCCRRCVIDNTSVILAFGSGTDAVFSPEMKNFARMYGFTFFAHNIMDSNRKGKIERPFYYVETNFLAGRTFKDWDDLNLQVVQWCHKVNQKEKRELQMSPACAYAKETPYLIPLPEVAPPIYEHYQRLVDTKGFVNLDTNRYSVPENLIGRTLDVYKYPEEVRLSYKHQEIAAHKRLAGKRYDVSRIPGHHVQHHEKKTQHAANEVEALLRSYHELLDLYVSGLKQRIRGRGLRSMQRLLNLKRTYPQDAFIKAIKQAHQYGMYDLNRLEELIIKSVAGNYFNLTGD